MASNNIQQLLGLSRAGRLSFEQEQRLEGLREAGAIDKYDEFQVIGELQRNTLLAGAQGLTFGFADELLGSYDYAVDKIFGGRGGETTLYGNIGRRRRQIEEFREDRPYLSAGAELVGGIAGFAVGGLAAGAAKGLGLATRGVGAAGATGAAGTTAGAAGGTQALTTMQRLGVAAAEGTTGLPRVQTIGQAAKAGAGFGGLYALGEAEGGIAERLPEAIKGAGVGAAAGGGLNLSLRVGGKTVTRLKDALHKTFSPTTARIRVANNALVKELSRTSLAPEDFLVKATQVLSRFDETASPASIADALDDHGIQLAGYLMDDLPAIKVAIAEQLKTRATETTFRALSSLQDNMSRGTFYNTMDVLAVQMKEQAGKHYRSANVVNKIVPLKTGYERTGLGTEKEIISMLDDKFGREILEETSEYLSRLPSATTTPALGAGPVTLPKGPDGYTNKELADIAKRMAGWGKGNSLWTNSDTKVPFRLLKELKEATSIKILSRHANKDTGKLDKHGTELYKRVKAIGKYLEDEAIDVAGHYRKANALWSDHIEVFKGAHAGLKVASENSEMALREALKEVTSEAGREALLVGYTRGLARKLGKGTAKEMKESILANEAGPQREILKKLAPTEEGRSRFTMLLENEAKLHENMENFLKGAGTSNFDTHSLTMGRRMIGSLAAIAASSVPLGGHDLVRAGAGRTVAMSMVHADPRIKGIMATILFETDAIAREANRKILVDTLTRSKMLTSLANKLLRVSNIYAGQSAGGTPEAARGLATKAKSAFTTEGQQ